VEPRSSPPVWLGVSEAKETASLFLASLAWDINPNLLSNLSVDGTADDAEGASGSSFDAVGDLGDVMLHLSGMSVYEMSWERTCALTIGRLMARAGVYLDGELFWRWVWS